MMRELDLDQVQFGALAGASKSVVNQWLSGNIQNISAAYAFRLQHRTGFSAEWIQLGEGEKKFKRFSLGSPLSPDELQMIEAYRHDPDHVRLAIDALVVVAVGTKRMDAVGNGNGNGNGNGDGNGNGNGKR